MRMRIKTLKLLCLFLFCGIAICSADTKLILLMETGRIHSYYLSEKPELSFEGTQLVISVYDQVAENYAFSRYERDEVKEFYFESNATDIDGVKPNELKFFCNEGNTVRISGLTEKDLPLRVYNLNGVICPVEINQSGNDATISLDALNKGLYVIQIGETQSIKIVKK